MVYKKIMLKVLHGTMFENQVWAELKKIPYGEIRTYKQIAIALGRPNAIAKKRRK